MSRLCRLGLLAVCVAVVGIPASTEAGVIPWMYDAVFGPPGSMQYAAGYTPYSAGYSSYYTPYSAGYVPYSAGYAPGGCSSCASYSSSACGCSPCAGNCGTGCASGNCSTGACSTTVNSAPAGTPIPVPDPANSARSIENRLEVIEKALHITPPPKNKTYDDKFDSVRDRGTETSVPLRPRRGSGDESFSLPLEGKSGGTDDGGLFEENRPGRGGAGTTESLKIPLPGDDNKTETVIPSKKPAPGLPIDDKGTPSDGKGTTTEEAPKAEVLKLENRITSRAVSPRERQVISAGFAKPAPVVSRKAAPNLRVDSHPQTVNVARH